MTSRPSLPSRCSACGGTSFDYREVLWPELVAAWELSPEEEAYINRQQGVRCLSCGNNLRMIALADAIVREGRFDGTLASFCESAPSLRLLEINAAGFLTQFLRKLPGHRLIEYPAFDMMGLAIPDESFDMVIHSDSLEHVSEPVRGMSECRRVLKPGGACLFTVPVVVGRLTRSRQGLPPIHHGDVRSATNDLLVRHEFGADAWSYALRAGFRSCAIESFEWPSALTFVARN